MVFKIGRDQGLFEARLYDLLVLTITLSMALTPLLLLVMPLVKVLPRTPACEVGRLCVVCCAMAVVPNKASRPTARESFFIPSSTKKHPLVQYAPEADRVPLTSR